MTNFAVVLGMIFLLFCIGLVVLHSSKLGRLTLLDWAVLGMGGVYGLGWAVVVSVTGQGNNPAWEDWLLPFESLYPLHTIAAMILLVAACIGWYTVGGVNLFGAKLGPKLSEQACGRLKNAMWALLIIAFGMQWLYTRAYGGFINLLDYSVSIRSAIFTIENPLSFLKPFAGLALFASFGYWGLWLSRRRSFDVVLALLLSATFSLYILYSWRGRIAFLVYLATFILGALLIRRKRPLRLLVGGGGIMFAILVGAYYVSVLFNIKAADSLPVFLARELAFPFGSFFGQLSSGEHLFRGFRDFLYAPVFLLPSSWWINWVENVSQINTALILGAPKGEQGVTGSIPVDLLTLGLMQAHFLGIILVGMLFGALLRIVQWLIDRIPNQGIAAVFEAHAALKLSILGIFYAQPSLFIGENFDFLITAILVALFLYLPHLNLFPCRFVLTERKVMGQL